MGRRAFLFPGQGSQYVGMGKDWYESDSAARKMFDSADSILGIKLSDICFNGPEDQLRQTRNTQPAIFLHSMVVIGSLGDASPEAAAGHSLGEYSALVSAGVLTFEDALRLVRLRGELMQAAGTERPGTMAAIVGLSDEQVTELCNGVQGVVQPANFNSPGQVVISGSVEAVRSVVESARTAGAKLAKELVVSGAFHSPLMEGAKEGLKKALDETAFADAKFPVYGNVTAEPSRDGNELRELLCAQLTSPVRWEQTIRNMVRDGVTECTELGPGRVLQGLVLRTDRSLKIAGIDRWSAPAPEGSC